MHAPETLTDPAWVTNPEFAVLEDDSDEEGNAQLEAANEQIERGK